MNENAEKWLHALENGGYQQAALGIRLPDGYCCMGVACDVYHRETGNGIWVQKTMGRLIDGEPFFDTIWYFSVDGTITFTALPHVVRQWLGLKSRYGWFGDEESQYITLLQANDEGVPFTGIAAIIRENEVALFDE